MQGMRGQRGRVTRRSGRSPPYAPPRQAWGTTVTATHTHRRGSGNELRFSFGLVCLVCFILVGRNQGSGAPCASSATVPDPPVADPTVFDGAATIQGIGVHQVVMLPIILNPWSGVDRGKRVQVVCFHDSILQGQRGHPAPLVCQCLNCHCPLV